MPSRRPDAVVTTASPAPVVCRTGDRRRCLSPPARLQVVDGRSRQACRRDSRTISSASDRPAVACRRRHLICDATPYQQFSTASRRARWRGVPTMRHSVHRQQPAAASPSCPLPQRRRDLLGGIPADSCLVPDVLADRHDGGAGSTSSPASGSKCRFRERAQPVEPIGERRALGTNRHSFGSKSTLSGSSAVARHQGGAPGAVGRREAR
jgi:hypothetical protein